MPRARKAPSFTLVIWIMVSASVLYLLCWPVAESLWAEHTWDKVPCHLDSSNRFVFLYNGEKYSCNRLDFWKRTEVNAYKTETIDIPDANLEQFCYVKHNDPTWAVLYVDALHHLDHAFHGAMVAVFVIVAGGILTWASRRSAPKSPDPSAPIH